MKRLIAEHPYLRLFDHHQTALQNLAGLPGCVLDMERSGAMITWQTLTQEQAGASPEQADAPDFIRYVQDRDLWCWQLPDSGIINAYIASMPYQFTNGTCFPPHWKTEPTASLPSNADWLCSAARSRLSKPKPGRPG